MATNPIVGIAGRTCPRCHQLIKRGDDILYHYSVWVHAQCPKLQIVWRNPEPKLTADRPLRENWQVLTRWK